MTTLSPNGAAGIDLAPLAQEARGRVVTAADHDYHELRVGFNGMINRHPLALVRVLDEADIAAAIRFARQHHLPLAIRAGGHSAPGFGSCDDGIVIDVREMRSTAVDPAKREIRCGSGLMWRDFDAATQEHGLALTGGRVSTTGVTGLTIGSGSGWLERKLGLTSDRLIGGRMITSEGDMVLLEEDPDLLWALRGGGGNFGVLSELRFSLAPLGPLVTGGVRFYPIEHAAEVLKRYRDIMHTAPEDLCGGISLLNAPPAPFIPSELQGKPVVALMVLWAGDPTKAERGIAPLAALGEPAVDLVGPIPYTQLQQLLDAGSPFGQRDYFKAGFIGSVSDEAIDAISSIGADLKAPLTQVVIAPLGTHTTYARYREDHSAIGNRDEGWSFQVLSLWADAADDDAQIAWTRAAADTLSSFSSLVSYPNFLSIEDPNALEDTFESESLAKLRRVKRKYDPENVFRINHNILPA